MTFTLTLTAANTNYNLFSLIKAVRPTWEFDECKQLQVQTDAAPAGAIYRRGDSNLSDTVFGGTFPASTMDSAGPLDNGGIFLSDIYYRSSAASGVLHVSFILR